MNVDLAKAMANFQQEVPAIHKATKGYGYTYADLPTILEVINPLMKKHGLGFTQIVNGTQLCTSIFHVETGNAIEGKMDIPQGVQLKGMNEFQVLGSALTYLRRYHLSAMLGLVTDADLDAAGEQTKSSKPTLSQSRFEKAMEAIENGDYEPKELREKYALNNSQSKVLADYEK
jgi:hypothetical protein